MALEQNKKTKKKAQENPSFGTCFHTNFQFKFHNYDWYKIGTNYRTNFESNNKHSSLSLFFWTLIFLPTCMIFIIFFSFIQITWFVFYNFSQDVQKIQLKFQLKIRSDQFPVIFTSSYVQARNTSDFNIEIKSSVYVA